MATMQAKGYVEVVKADGGLVGAVASTGSTDRDGEILDPNGWNLANFVKNPVLLWSHNPMELPVGKVTNIRMENGKMLFDAEFAEKESDFARKVADMYRGGFLNAFSVGFIPHQKQGDRFTNLELLEISCVNIPANADALNRREYKSFTEAIKELETKDTKTEAKEPQVGDPCQMEDGTMGEMQMGDNGMMVCKLKTKAEEVEQKAGRILSEKNRNLIRNATDTMRQSISALEELLALTEPEEKTEGAHIVKVEKRKAPRNELHQALRIVDRAVEHAIHLIKEKQ